MRRLVLPTAAGLVLVASAGLALAAALVLSGCNFITTQATLKPYDASDGVSTTIGDVGILNALVLSEDGINGNLVFTALNSTGEPVEVRARSAAGYDLDADGLRVRVNRRSAAVTRG